MLDSSEYYMPWAMQMVNCANCRWDPGKKELCSRAAKTTHRYWRICEHYDGLPGAEVRRISRKVPANLMERKNAGVSTEKIRREPIMRCGARTKSGGVCKLTSLATNGRCRFHGGMSTGPRTATGKQRVSRNGVATRFGSPERAARLTRKSEPACSDVTAPEPIAHPRLSPCKRFWL